MRVQIKNKHCFQWLKAYIKRLTDLHDIAAVTFKRTDANIRIERIESHFNKYYESYYIEYSNFAIEKRYTIKIRISEYKLAKNKHNIY
ncbi:TPA_asm: hypothetical protein ES702_05909 [Lokiarchaeia virus SkuldV3]|uniref:Uncharacterized protein n=1 Tax=Lokiarchaeia virus SkuldV3 TaxID=2983915 RepID=A0A9N6YJQ5_9VIRU|nr:hypothetical protein QKT74_gp06 [Lokiarchaeia virus SkuldV3]DAZ90946.1 TPA_asm: hypothetical protein ES702_05909 [Lokiarchaeia virus SkuldV3]